MVVDLKGMPHGSILELASSIRKVPSLETLPVLALSMGLTPAGEQELKDAGISHIINKPLRYTTLATVLLETVGVPARARMKKPNANANMLTGRKILVVSQSPCLQCLFLCQLWVHGPLSPFHFYIQVDDNMVNRRVASSMLSRYGATVTSVDGGMDAVNAVKNQQEGEEFDLILMDIQMPEVNELALWLITSLVNIVILWVREVLMGSALAQMDGWEATRQIRRWELEVCQLCQNSSEDYCPHHRLPIVAVTADVVVKTRSLCFSSGMDDYITKVLCCDQSTVTTAFHGLIGMCTLSIFSDESVCLCGSRWIRSSCMLYWRGF